jgi:capsular polysaccharide export protein
VIVQRPGFWSLAGLGVRRMVREVDVEAVLSTHLRRKAVRHPLFARSPFWLPYTWCRLLLERFRIGKYLAYFLRERVDYVGVWNGQKKPGATIAAAAELAGAQPVFFENGLLPKTTTVDLEGVNARNSLPRHPSYYMAYRGEAALPNRLVQRASVRDRTDSPDLELPPRYVFVPFQVATDSQIIAQSPWVHDMRQLYGLLLRALDRVAEDAPDLHVVIKEHPSCSVRYDDLHARDSRVLFANTHSTQELIEGADAVVTINSTVGVESLLLGKSVLTLGEAFYNIQDLVLHANDDVEFLDLFEQLLDFLPDDHLRTGFLAYLNNEYCIPEPWVEVSDRHIKAWEARVLKADLHGIAAGDTSALSRLQPRRQAVQQDQRLVTEA